MAGWLKRITPLTKAVAIAFCFVALFLSAYTFVYYRAESSLQSITLKQINAHITQGSSEIDSAAQRIVTQITELHTDPTIISLRSASTLSISDYAQLLTLSDKLETLLSSIKTGSGCFSRIFLLFDHPTPFICASNGIYHNLDRAIQSKTIGVQGMDTAEFLDLIRSSVSSTFFRHLTPVQSVYIKEYTEDAFLFVLRLPRTASTDVYAVLQINSQLLFDTLLSSSTLGSPAAVYNHQQLLFSTLDLAEKPEHYQYDSVHNTTYLSTPIDAFGMEAYVHVSDQSIKQQIQEFTYLLYTLLFLAMALFLILFVMAGFTLVYPLQHMKQQLQVHGHESFNTFENEYNRITANLALIKPALHTSLLDKLFRQDYLTPAERAALQTIPDLPLNTRCRVMLLGAIGDRDISAEHKKSLESLLQETVDHLLIHPLSEGRFALIHPCTQPDDTLPLQEELELLLCAIQERMPASAWAIGVSQPCHGLDAIHTAYQEASNAFKEQWSWNQSGVRFHEKSNDQALYNVTLDELDHLYRLLCSGAGEDAVRHFEAIVEREFGSDFHLCRDQGVCLQFFSDIRGILLRLNSRFDLSAIHLSYIAYHEEQQFSHIMALLRNGLYYVASLASGKQEESENSLAQSIQLYLQENYADPNISLAGLAALFDMSESTMSRFFKAHMGVTFSTHLENMRLNEAETLLTSTELPVKDIVAMIGYTNTTTFYKAFRRKWGVSPSTHRDVTQKQAMQ